MKKATAVLGIIVAVIMLQFVPVMSGADDADTQSQKTLTCPHKTAAACCTAADGDCCKKDCSTCTGEKCENCTGDCANCAKTSAVKTCPKTAKAATATCPHKAACCNKASAQVIEKEESTVQKN